MSKFDLCVEFIGLNEDSDDLLSIAEQLSEMVDQDVDCVYPSKVGCKRKSTTPYGFCNRHTNTKKGKAVKQLYDNALLELTSPDAPESDDESIPPSEDSSSEENIEAEYVPAEDDSETKRQDEADEVEKHQNEDGMRLVGGGQYEFVCFKTKNGDIYHKPSGLMFNGASKTAIGTYLSEDDKTYFLTEQYVEFCKKYNIKYNIDNVLVRRECGTVHVPTGLVFNTRTKTAIGKDAGNGKLYVLSDDDIEYCKNKRLRYTQPKLDPN